MAASWLAVSRAERNRAGLLVEAVEDLGHHLVRVAPAGLGQRRDELVAQRGLDMVERSFCTDPMRSMRQTTSTERSPGRWRSTLAMVGANPREDHRDGLRLSAQEVRQHERVDIAELLLMLRPAGPRFHP